MALYPIFQVAIPFLEYFPITPFRVLTNEDYLVYFNLRFSCLYVHSLFVPGGDDSVCVKGGSGFPHFWKSGMWVSLPSGACKTLERMGGIGILHASALHMSLYFMTYCSSCDVYWQCCKNSWFSFNYNTCDFSDVPLCRAFSTCLLIADAELIDD